MNMQYFFLTRIFLGRYTALILAQFLQYEGILKQRYTLLISHAPDKQSFNHFH